MPGTTAPQPCTATRIPAELDARLRPVAFPAAPAGWLNDPNGPIHHRGRYHLFYQHNPRAAGFDPHMHWGHLSSVDLARWRHHPLALVPDAAGADGGGCWSGCIVVDDQDRVHAIYSTPEQRVCRATADDASLETWQRDGCALLDTADDPTGSGHHRDPCVLRHDGAWLMVLAGQREGRGCIELWRSDDLLGWSHLGCALRDDGNLPLRLDHGAIWECASLFPLDGRWVLLLACCDWSRGLRRTVAYVGDFDGRRFQPVRGRIFDHGAGNCYAAITCVDHGGRRLLWSWIAEGPGARAEWGWAGCLSWPHELTLVDDELRARIPDELATLRRVGSHRRLTPGGREAGTSVDIELRATRLGAFPLDLRVLDDGAGRALRIGIDPIGSCLVVDRRDWLDHDADERDSQRALHLAPLEPGDLADCRLRVVVDRSLIQVHCNDRIRITTRVYPPQAADGIVLTGAVESADCWDLEPCILPEA